MKQKSLDTTALEHVIRIKLSEQLAQPANPNTWYKNPFPVPFDKKKSDDALRIANLPHIVARNKIADDLAQRIYKSKGVLWDNEFDAVKAILLIPDRDVFYRVQQKLRDLTGGLGIGQYVTSFLTVGKDRRFSSKRFYGKLLGLKPEKYPLTKKYINRIFDRLYTLPNAPKNLEGVNQYKSLPYSTISYFQNFELNFEQEEQNMAHMILGLTGMVTGIIPFFGWGVSAGIFALDAAIYAKEGRMKEAGLSAIFAALPGITRIPAIQKLGEKGMAALGYKLATSSNPVLTNLERVAISQAWKQRYFIKHGLDNYMKVALYNQLRNGAIRNRLQAKYGTKAMNVLFKIADGSLKLTGAAAKIAIPFQAFSAGIEQYNKLFDKYYAYAEQEKIQMNSGSDKEQIDSMFDPKRLPQAQPADATYVQKK